MHILLYLLVNSSAVFATSYVLPGVKVENFVTAIIVAVVLGVLNSFVKPILIILTLPINILTFWLFTFVINAALVLLVSNIVPGFRVNGFWWALAFSLVLSIIASFLNALAR